jgi:peptidoglycan/LPS O-acetylase OafA/YrhL
VFLQNYLGVEGFGPSWSLCVEEHFYLALPLLGFVILRILGRRSLLWLLPIIALIPQLLRCILFLNGGFSPQWYFRSHYCAEGLVLGVWLAYVFVDRPELWLQLRKAAVPLAILPLGSLVFIYLIPVLPGYFQATLSLIYALGFAAWVRLFYDLRWSPATALSRLMKVTIHGLALSSYSIYLVHTLIFTDVRILMVGWPRGATKSSTILISTLLISIIFYFLVERPTIQLRDRLLKKPQVNLGIIHSASLLS